MSGAPGPLSRFVALFFCPGYLWLLAVLLSRSTGRPLYASLIAVTVGGMALMVIFAVLSARFFDPDKRQYRWTIGTFMLITAVMAIYMGYIGQFVAQFNGEPVTGYGVAVVAFYSSFFIGTTTAVLLYFADSLIMLADAFVFVFRHFRRR